MGTHRLQAHRIAFCDFDGTISDRNTLVEVLYRYADHDPGIEKKLINKEITLSEGVRYFMERIPSACYEDIAQYARRIRPRPGFYEMLALFRRRGIPFVILSGGLAFMAREALSNYGALISDVRAVEIDREGSYFKVIAPYDDGVELVAKRQIVKEYAFEHMICIGDGDTDFEIVKDADTIFACDQLAAYLARKGVPFHPFTDFFDIRNVISEWK